MVTRRLYLMVCAGLTVFWALVPICAEMFNKAEDFVVAVFAALAGIITSIARHTIFMSFYALDKDNYLSSKLVDVIVYSVIIVGVLIYVHGDDMLFIGAAYLASGQTFGDAIAPLAINAYWSKGEVRTR